MPDEEVPVLIVGGSLVGLTTAMLLGHHGVPSLSVERHAGTAIHPRAGHFQLRTMELLRQLGLEERVRAKSLETYSPTGGIIAVESLAGRELATYVQELNEGVEGFSPTRARLHQPGRARAAAARARARARRDGAQPHRGGRPRAGRRRRDRDAPRPRLGRRARGAGALRRRRGRQSQPDAHAAGNRHARLRAALAQHHDLLPRRLLRAAARPQPGRDLRAQPGAARVLPARPDRRQRLPRHQHGRRGRHAGLGGRRAGGTDRGASAGVPAHGDRDRHADGDRGHRQLAGRGELGRAAPRRPRVPRRRRRARRAAQRRLRRQHRRPGRAQPRLEARGGRARATPGRACSTPTRPSACR